MILAQDPRPPRRVAVFVAADSGALLNEDGTSIKNEDNTALENES